MEFEKLIKCYFKSINIINIIIYFEKERTEIYVLRIENDHYYQNLAKITVINKSRTLHSIKAPLWVLHFDKLQRGNTNLNYRK